MESIINGKEALSQFSNKVIPVTGPLDPRLAQEAKSIGRSVEDFESKDIVPSKQNVRFCS